MKPLQVKLIPPRSSITAGKRIEFKCQSIGSRPRPRISWFKSTTKLTDVLESHSSDSNVTISTVTFTPEISDNGKHLSCRADNPSIAGSGLEEAVRLHINCKFSLSSTSTSLLSVSLVSSLFTLSLSVCCINNSYCRCNRLSLCHSRLLLFSLVTRFHLMLLQSKFKYAREKHFSFLLCSISTLFSFLLLLPLFFSFPCPLVFQSIFILLSFSYQQILLLDQMCVIPSFASYFRLHWETRSCAINTRDSLPKATCVSRHPPPPHTSHSLRAIFKLFSLSIFSPLLSLSLLLPPLFASIALFIQLLPLYATCNTFFSLPLSLSHPLHGVSLLILTTRSCNLFRMAIFFIPSWTNWITVVSLFDSTTVSLFVHQLSVCLCLCTNWYWIQHWHTDNNGQRFAYILYSSLTHSCVIEICHWICYAVVAPMNTRSLQIYTHHMCHFFSVCASPRECKNFTLDVIAVLYPATNHHTDHHRMIDVPQLNLVLGANINANSIIEGSDVYTECHIRSNPPVYEVTWLFEGEPLFSDRSKGIIIANQTLVLQRIKKSSRGNYQCIGRNEIGIGKSNALFLRVQCE